MGCSLPMEPSMLLRNVLFHRQRATHVLSPVLRSDHFLLLLLRLDHFQYERSSRQYAQVRRVHSRNPSRQEHGRVYEQDSDQDHGRGWFVSFHPLRNSDDHDLRDQAATIAPGRKLDRYLFPPLAVGWPECQLLLRWDVAFDRGRRGHGYRESD